MLFKFYTLLTVHLDIIV